MVVGSRSGGSRSELMHKIITRGKNSATSRQGSVDSVVSGLGGWWSCHDGRRGQSWQGLTGLYDIRLELFGLCL